MSSIYFKGIEELTKACQEIPKELHDDARRVVQKNGADLQRNAQNNAPVDTGNLKRSINLDIEGDGLTARSRAQADYAGYVEWGTRKMDAQPYMKPAFEKQSKEFINDLKTLMGG